MAKTIPRFNDLGLLPAGVHPCSLALLHAVFVTNVRREQLFSSLVRCIAMMRGTQLAGTLLVDGSFVTDKPNPSDIEVTLDVRRQPRLVQDRALVFHVREKKGLEKIGVDWYPTLPDNLSRDFTRYFQYAGEKTAADKRCDPKEPKGILRLTRW